MTTTCMCILPAHEWGITWKCDNSGPATRTHWGNGHLRLMTPEAYTLAAHQARLMADGMERG